jgi:uroporphyrinogen-III synthase
VAKLSGTFTPIFSPLIGISFLGKLPVMDGYSGLVFTSAHGVKAYVNAGGPKLPAFTVGNATALAAETAGISAQSADGNADDLVKWLAGIQDIGPLLHVRGVFAQGNVAERLTARGITTAEAVLYDQPEIPLNLAAHSALLGETPVVAPVFSPRTAALLAKNRIKAPLLVAAMSEAVAKPLAGLHKMELKVAARPESPAMVKLVTELLERACAKD